MGVADFIQGHDKIALLGVKVLDGETSSFNYSLPDTKLVLHEVVGLVSAARQLEKDLIKQSASFMEEDELNHLLQDLNVPIETIEGPK